MGISKVHSVKLMNTGAAKTLLFEPWAEELPFPNGAEFRVVCEGAETGEMEIEMDDDYIIVYGISSSSLRVFADGKQIWESYEMLQ